MTFDEIVKGVVEETGLEEDEVRGMLQEAAVTVCQLENTLSRIIPEVGEAHLERLHAMVSTVADVVEEDVGDLWG